MAAPLFRAKTMVPSGTSTKLEFTVPATTVAGDTLYIAIKVEAGSPVTIGLPTGGQTWKAVAAQKEEPVEKWTVAVFELANWNGTDTKYTVAWGGASDPRSGTIFSFSGTDKSTPRNATSNATIKEVTPASKNAVVDGYTTTVNECRRVSLVFNNEGLLVSPASGWTEDGDQADSPEIAHKTEAVNSGVQASVTHTTGANAVFLALGWALQPPQPNEYVDTGSGTITESGSRSENAVYSDSGSGTETLSGSGVESHVCSGSGAGTITLTGSGTESYAHTVSRTGTITLSGSSTQSYEVKDSRSGTVTSSGSATETFQFVDSRSGTATLSGSAAEGAEGADRSTGELVFTASASESFEVDDAAEGAISFNGASDEDWSVTDSASGSIAVEGVAEGESWGFTRSATGTLVLEGSGVETWGFTSSGEGTITFGGKGVEAWGFSRDQLADPPTFLILAGKSTSVSLQPKDRTLSTAGRESALTLQARESELDLHG